MKRIDRYNLNEQLAEILLIGGAYDPPRHQQLRRRNTALEADERTIDRIFRWTAKRVSGYDGEARPRWRRAGSTC